MDKCMVKMENRDSWVGTWDLSLGLKMRHRELRDLVEKYRHKLEKHGPLKKYGLSVSDEIFEIDNENIQDQTLVTNNLESVNIHDVNSVVNIDKKIKKKRGGQVEQFLINENQYIFLLTILPNSERTIDFKERLSDDFIRMRKVIQRLMIQRADAEWIEKRKAVIVERKAETDTIKDFIEYATNQGSKRAVMYYIQITKMQNDSLLGIELMELKFGNIRDMLSGFDLDAMKMCDRIVSRALTEGMRMEMNYKDIYLMCKDKVEAFAMAIGKTPLRLLKKDKEKIASIQ